MNSIFGNKSKFALKLKHICLLIALMSIPVLSFADEQSDREAILKALELSFPSLQIDQLERSPVSDIYEVVSGGSVYYVSNDGKYLFDGSLIDILDQSNLTERKENSLHLSMINSMPETDMLVYEATGDASSGGAGRSITVFTDTTCPFCSRLHSEIDSILDAGIKVRYLLFPRAGLGSQAHMELESVWCSENPQEAMTIAKAGGSVDHHSCDNPIESHVALAEQVGLRGTPLIYLDSGEAIPGYRSAGELVSAINGSTPMDLQ